MRRVVELTFCTQPQNGTTYPPLEVNAVIDYYSTPILTARETARYLGLPESTLDVWLLERDKSPLIHAVQPER